VSLDYINGLLLLLMLSAAVLLVLGNWIERLVVIVVPTAFALWAYWYDRTHK